VADDDLPWLFLRVILIVEDASERVVENGAPSSKGATP
jgi:hypothetical protein